MRRIVATGGRARAIQFESSDYFFVLIIMFDVLQFAAAAARVSVSSAPRYLTPADIKKSDPRRRSRFTLYPGADRMQLALVSPAFVQLFPPYSCVIVSLCTFYYQALAMANQSC